MVDPIPASRSDSCKDLAKDGIDGDRTHEAPKIFIDCHRAAPKEGGVR